MDNRNRSVDKKRAKFVARKVQEAEAELRSLESFGLYNGDSLHMKAVRKVLVLKNELRAISAPQSSPSANIADWRD